MKRYYETEWDWDGACHWCVTPCPIVDTMIGSIECHECSMFQGDVFHEFGSGHYVNCAAADEEKAQQ